RHKEREIAEERKGKNKNERSTKVTSAQSECREKVQKERKGKREKEVSIRDDFSETEGDDTQSDNENEMMTKESDNETSASSSGEETVNLLFQGEVREKADKSKVSAREKKSVEPKRKGRIKEKNQHKEKHKGAGDERGQYSDGEVHETPPHKSNEVESEDGKGIKEARIGKKRMAQSVKEHLSLSSTREQQIGKRNAPVASTRGKTHSKQGAKQSAESRRETGVSSTRKTTALPLEEDMPGSDSAQYDSENDKSDADGSENDRDGDSEQKSSNEEEEEEETFPSEVREKADKSKVPAREKKVEQKRKGRMKEKQTEKEKQRRAGDERGQSSDGEVHETPRHKLKISKGVESEGGKQNKEAQKGKKKAMKMAQSVKESLSLRSTKEQQKGKRNAPLDEAASTREKYLKTHSNQSTKPPESRETGVSLTGKTKKTAALPLEDDTPGSGSAQYDSEYEESDADGSSEDEEDKDSEQKSSNEEEEEEEERKQNMMTSLLLPLSLAKRKCRREPMKNH
ncbi:hypothetical protein GBAR_LOCUS27681, partial [Geodia barretti]